MQGSVALGGGGGRGGEGGEETEVSQKGERRERTGREGRGVEERGGEGKRGEGTEGISGKAHHRPYPTADMILTESESPTIDPRPPQGQWWRGLRSGTSSGVDLAPPPPERKYQNAAVPREAAQAQASVPLEPPAHGDGVRRLRGPGPAWDARCWCQSGSTNVRSLAMGSAWTRGLGEPPGAV